MPTTYPRTTAGQALTDGYLNMEVVCRAQMQIRLIDLNFYCKIMKINCPMAVWQMQTDRSM